MYLFNEFAEVESFLGNATGAAFYQQLSSNISAAMNTLLWEPKSDDHYATNLQPNGQLRDFVDYDSNLFAILAGVASPDRAAKILARIDKGGCAHPRGTWVSEIYYDAQNCNGGNTGDSAITMGRITWADARARYQVGGPDAAAFFQNVLLQPLQQDTLDNTWLYERCVFGVF